MNEAMRARKFVPPAGAGLLLLALAGSALGSGFALQEQSGSGLGNAFAGGAAVAEDPGTIYTNPAGLTRLPAAELAVATSLICPSIKFANGGSQPAALQTLGGAGGDAGACKAVPAIYLAVPVNDRWWFGLGLNAPFGLTTDYESGWIGRFQALKSEVKTINVNPALAFRLSDRVALAAGVNWQRIDATLTSRVNYAGGFGLALEQLVEDGDVPLSAVPDLLVAALGLESGATISGNDTAWGWNVGLLFTPDPATRVGLQYRSKIDYRLRGSVQFRNPSLPPLAEDLQPYGAAVAALVDAQLASGPVSLELDVPESANLSVFRELTDNWQFMADLQFTGWSSVQGLQIERADDSTLSNTPEFFRDTWRFAAGLNYVFSDRWMLRTGIAFDQSPVRDAERTPRLPDNKRRWITAGLHYRYSPRLSVDAAVAHLYISRTRISQDEGSADANALIDGSYTSDVNLGAIQVNYRFR